MFKILRIAFSEAVHTLRSNFFHTLLSTLGIVIGVAALVSILSLGDGIEQYGREQLASNTDLANVVITPITTEKVDGIFLKKKHIPILQTEQVEQLDSLFADRASIVMQVKHRGWVQVQNDTAQRPAIVIGSRPNIFPDTLTIQHGRVFNQEDYQNRDTVAVLTHTLAKKLADSTKTGTLIGKQFEYDGTSFEIVGIVSPREKEEPPTAIIPIYAVSETKMKNSPPSLMITANTIEDASDIQKESEEYLEKEFKGGKKEFMVVSNEFWLDQFKKGVMVFKIIFGMITGIAVLVGGIGVMNVLLMSITERTREIGIRKALGAKRRTIAMQFLAEAFVISLAGCFLGFVLGLGFMAIAVPVVKHFAEVPVFVCHIIWLYPDYFHSGHSHRTYFRNLPCQQGFQINAG